jgi:Peptidase family M1 domain
MNVSKKIVVLFLLGCLFRLTARPQDNPLSPLAPATRDSPSPQAAYWQQQVNYTIDVTLDDTAHALDGSIKIQYINHSPDTLSFIWIHCWPNAYKNDRTAFSEQRIGNGQTDFYFSSPAQRGYMNRLEFRVDGQLARMEDHPQYIDIIKVILPTPLPPGGQAVLTTPFHVKLPYDFSRSGYYKGAYSLTQWYPKPAVYDSHGWHPIPYLDQGEFYSEFGDFDVHITVPAGFIVAATGEWQDAPASRQQSGPSPAAATTAHPLSPPNHHQPVNRPATHSVTHATPTSSPHPATHPAAHSAHPPLPSATEPALATALAPVPAEPTKTLHYYQRQIHDFAWFANRQFHTEHDTLRLPSGRIIDVYSFYTPAATPAWRHSIQYIKDAIRFRSALIGEYPFDVVTAVQAWQGDEGGMEYPTITAIHIPRGTDKELDLTIEHEVGHNWFYAVLGTDERRYPWLDEGINSYYDNRYSAWKYPTPGRPSVSATSSGPPAWLAKKIPADGEPILMNSQAAIHSDQPISTPAEDFTAENYELIAYTKTAVWMKLLQDSLGTSLFDSCMREYFRTWQFRHPYPDDLKTIFTATSHRNLDELFALLDRTGPLPPFPAHRPLRPTLLFNVLNAHKFDYLNILPAAGYNDYDHFMIGVLIHNFNLPPQNWQMLLAPLYATGSHQLNGIAHFNYAWYPPAAQPSHNAPASSIDRSLDRSLAFRMIEAGVNASRFSTLSGTDSNGHQIFGGFYKVVPYVRLYFPKSSPRSTQDSWLEWKTYLIGEKNLGNYVLRTTDSLYYPTAGKYEFRYLNQLSFTILDHRVLYPYKVTLQVQQAAPFYRINLNTNYFFNYGTSGGLDIRLFGAKFGYLGGMNPSQDLTAFEPKLTAVRGADDYTYDNYFIGRNEYNGFASQQIMDRDGFLKLRTDLFQGLQGRSDDWVASINLTSTLPPRIVPTWLPLKLFLDIGTYAAAWQANPTTSHFLYVGGFELSLLHDILRIYAPLAYSSDFSNQLKSVPGQNGFFQKISFSIDFENIPFRQLFGYTPF